LVMEEFTVGSQCHAYKHKSASLIYIWMINTEMTYHLTFTTESVITLLSWTKNELGAEEERVVLNSLVYLGTLLAITE
jgi:hypothetical protein